MTRTLATCNPATRTTMNAPTETRAFSPDGHTLEAARHVGHNERLIRCYFEEVWNQGRLDVLDELLAPDYLNHSASVPNPRPGPADLKPIVAQMRAAIADLHYEILDLVVTPTKAAVYLRVTGRHVAPLWGMAPKGSGAIDVRQMQIEWIRDGRIVQHWRLTDELALLRQLGQL